MVGLVFGIAGPTPGEPLDTQVGSRIVSKIGKRAKVVVSQDGGRLKLDKKTGLKVAGPKFAGAHDLRRAFGTRWSKRVMPAVLKQLMHHASIETTMSYYVAHNADDVAADLWAGFGNSPGNSGPETSLAERLPQPAEER